MKNVDMRILTLPYWQQPKYKNILTNNIFKRTYEEIIEIMEFPYWNIEKFKKLFSPMMFIKNKKQIIELLSLPYWEDKKFESLLTPSIFMKDANQIVESIEYCRNNDLENHIKKVLIYNNSYKELVVKTNYLKENGIPLHINGKLNGIYSASNRVLKEKYGMTRNELINKYYNNKGDKYVL